MYRATHQSQHVLSVDSLVGSHKIPSGSHNTECPSCYSIRTLFTIVRLATMGKWLQQQIWHVKYKLARCRWFLQNVQLLMQIVSWSNLMYPAQTVQIANILCLHAHLQDMCLHTNEHVVERQHTCKEVICCSERLLAWYWLQFLFLDRVQAHLHR